MVEDRLRRLAEQEQGQREGEGVADAIDHKQAAFILGMGYDCIESMATMMPVMLTMMPVMLTMMMTSAADSLTSPTALSQPLSMIRYPQGPSITSGACTEPIYSRCWIVLSRPIQYLL
jgi:hypothetical protein